MQSLKYVSYSYFQKSIKNNQKISFEAAHFIGTFFGSDKGGDGVAIFVNSCARNAMRCISRSGEFRWEGAPEGYSRAAFTQA